MNPSPGDRFSVSANPPPGHPYLPTSQIVDWPKGAVERPLDLALSRGVLIRGKVVEDGSNRPVAGAAVAYVAHPRPEDVSRVYGGEAETATDGSFAMAVLPRKGYLAVRAPGDHFVLREIGNQEFFRGRPGGRRLSSHAFVACEPKPDGPSLEINISVQPGISVSGRVVGPDDQPVTGVWLLGRGVRGPSPVPWSMWQGSYHRIAFNGHFELHGLEPSADVPVYFLEPKRKLGATMHLSDKSGAGGPVTVRLEPCGTAKARLVDAKSRPLGGYRDELLFAMMITPGPSSADPNGLRQDGDFLNRIDAINYQKPPVSDDQGRIMFPALIPGATYRIADHTAKGDDVQRLAIRKEFTVKPGETVDLGEILIEQPRNP